MLLGLDGNGPWPRLLAAAVVVCFAALNLAGAQVVGRAEAVLVYFKLAVLLLFCLGGLAFVDAARVSPAAFPPAGSIVYAGALIFLGYEGFELIANASEDARDPERTLPRAYLIAVAAVVSTCSAINATLYGAAKFTYLMGRDGELPARFGRPVWNRPVGGLLATTAGTLVIVSTVNIEGISLMGSAGFLIIFAAVNLAAARLAGTGGRARVLPLAGALACAACLAGLIAYAATHIPAQLAVLGGLIAAAVLGEAIIRIRGRPAAHPAPPPAREHPQPGPGHSDRHP